MSDVNLYIYIEKRPDAHGNLNFIVNGERYRVAPGGALVEWKNVTHSKWIECGWFPAATIGGLNKSNYPAQATGWALNAIRGREVYEQWCFDEEEYPHELESVSKFIEKFGRIDEHEDYFVVVIIY